MQNWTQQEDSILLQLYSKIDIYNKWKQISKKLSEYGYHKTELQCRNRYHNKVNPKINFNQWQNKQIKDLFKFYDQYGSRWNIIQTFLPGRTQNNIKNRFFTTLKNLLRKLLKKYNHPQNQKALRNAFTSRYLTDLYEGRRSFKKFKNLLKKILRKINFQITYQTLQKTIQENEQALKQILEIFLQSNQKNKNKLNKQNTEKNILQIEQNSQVDKKQFIKNENIHNQYYSQYLPNFNQFSPINNSYIIFRPYQQSWKNYMNWNQYMMKTYQLIQFNQYS